MSSSNKSGDHGVGIRPSYESGDRVVGMSLSYKSGDHGVGMSLTYKSGDHWVGMSLSYKSGNHVVGISPSYKSGHHGVGMSLICKSGFWCFFISCPHFFCPNSFPFVRHSSCFTLAVPKPKNRVQHTRIHELYIVCFHMNGTGFLQNSNK